jgi:hypothetical protein
MPWGSVTVTGRNGRNVYVNGLYGEARGKVPGPFVVEMGLNTFETLDRKRRVNFRADATVDRAHPAVSVAFEPVNPPEPTS